MNARDPGLPPAGERGGRIHPHWLPRLGMLLPTVVLVAASVGAWQEHPTDGQLAVAVVVVTVCLLVAARWILFAGIRRRGDRVVVTGMLWSRSVPLRQIDRVISGYAFILWRMRSGVRLITPVTALWSNPNPLPDVTRYNNRRLRLLRDWVSEARGPNAA